MQDFLTNTRVRAVFQMFGAVCSKKVSANWGHGADRILQQNSRKLNQSMSKYSRVCRPRAHIRHTSLKPPGQERPDLPYHTTEVAKAPFPSIADYPCDCRAMGEQPIASQVDKHELHKRLLAKLPAYAPVSPYMQTYRMGMQDPRVGLRGANGCRAWEGILSPPPPPNLSHTTSCSSQNDAKSLPLVR